MPKDYEDRFGTQMASITFTSESLKMSNLVGLSNDKIKEAFCFTSDGTYSLLNINYSNKSIEKIYERNMKDLKNNFHRRKHRKLYLMNKFISFNSNLF